MKSLLESRLFNQRLFFPRPVASPPPSGATDLRVSVADAELQLRWHRAARGATTLLLFHGNGETVADYDAIAPSFEACGARLAVVDYRGYGTSSGTPTLRRLIEDAPHVVARLVAAGADRLVVMGRSLGSACAAELYARGDRRIIGFVWESGFVDLDALLRRRSFDPELDYGNDRSDFDAVAKLRAGARPLLVLHGADDTLILPAEAERAFAAAGAEDKQLVIVPGRGHNDVSLHPIYWDALRSFLQGLG